MSDPVDLWVHGPHRLVPGHHIGDRGAQRVDIERTGQSNSDRDVV